MISQIVLDSNEFQQAFCEGCPAVSVIRGARDSLGVPQDPDDVTCPVDFDFADAGCARANTYERVVALLEEVEAWLRGA
jgi:hypothetical protein